MASIQRKVAFYYLSQERTGDDRKKHAVDLPGIETNFQYIYDKMNVLSNGHHAEKILYNNVNFVVEVIQYNKDNHLAFISIGYQNHANTAALRDQSTLELSSVPMEPSQKLEVFTYCLVDFSTGVVSHISLTSAPRVGALRAMFDHYLLSECKTSSSLSAIMSSDIIEMIKNKRTSKITVTVAVPDDLTLSNRIGVSRNAFDRLQNIKKVGYTYTISARRLRNIFNSPEDVGAVVAAIKEEHGTELQGLKVNAKGDGEDSQAYDLLQHSLTKKVSFDVEDISALTSEDFRTSLTNCYNSNKNDLIRYIPHNR